MAIKLSTAARNARGQALITEAGSNAILRVFTAAYGAALYDSVCAATLGTMSGGVNTFNAVANATATGAGTAAIARLYQSDGVTMVIEGLTVGTSGTNIIITNTTIGIGDTVTTTSGTITEGNP